MRQLSINWCPKRKKIFIFNFYFFEFGTKCLGCGLFSIALDMLIELLYALCAMWKEDGPQDKNWSIFLFFVVCENIFSFLMLCFSYVIFQDWRSIISWVWQRISAAAWTTINSASGVLSNLGFSIKLSMRNQLLA